MKVIGVSAFYHDSAVALVQDGEIVAANQEERFSRIKHDSSFPINALKKTIDMSGLKPEEIDAIAFYEKPYLKLERAIENIYINSPRSFISFYNLVKALFSKRFDIKSLLPKELTDLSKKPLYYVTHHLSHAASAFYPSPFERAAIITVDGIGEFSTLTIGNGKETSINIIKTMNFPHSLGLFYSAFTYYLGFKVNDGEYKLMGLSPYGSKSYLKYKKLLKENVVKINSDGSIFLNLDFFSFHTTNKMTNDDRLYKLLGFKRREEEEEIKQFHADLALAVQDILNESMINIAKTAKNLTREDNLVIAGGVALNCIVNTIIYKSGLFKNIWIQPASGDAGGALGCALYIDYNIGKSKRYLKKDSMKGSYLGPKYTNEEIKEEIKKFNLKYEFLSTDEIISTTAEQLAKDKVIGWFQGRMEWGPRALGNRSIIANPLSPYMQQKINMMIKKRESFRPFAPAVIEEYASEYFEPVTSSPFMLFISYVKDKYREKIPENYDELSISEKLNLKKSLFPAVTHCDFSARIQTVNKETNPLFYSLIKKFGEITGFYMLLNTSFNGKDEPIVESPNDAIKCFLNNGLDALVIENFFISRYE